MNPREFRKLIDRAGLSESEVARQLQISDRTIRRYLASPSNARLLLWGGGPLPVDAYGDAPRVVHRSETRQQERVRQGLTQENRPGPEGAAHNGQHVHGRAEPQERSPTDRWCQSVKA
jgi:hypothetical protein